MGDGTSVHGIIRTSDAPFRQYLDGIGDPSRPVRVLCQCEPGAIVSDAPEELRPKRRELLAHQHGLDQAAAGGGPRPRALPRVRRGRVRRRGVAGRRGGASAMRVPPPSRPRSERRRTSRRRGVVTRKTEGARAGTGAGLCGDVLTQEGVRLLGALVAVRVTVAGAGTKKRPAGAVPASGRRHREFEVPTSLLRSAP
ncbi:GvpL/GvpF family gas vesicle protein [Streptomyces sp. NPDC005706]|uniref:GvpL/GvpF family gas vesicle protein n=1 Tax=Streptomyces sp. NPDC005706 TaxID=3157169 RepID=UPI0033D934C7